MAAPTDITVVGAGIVGCAVAFELSRRGASVQIVDDRPAGMGATQASAGVLSPYIEARPGSPLLDLAVRSLDLFDGFIEQVAADSGLRVPYHRTGTLDVAHQDAAMARLRGLGDWLSARGVKAETVDAEGARELEPQLSPAIAGGLLIPSHGFVGASDLVRSVAAAARRHGVQILEQGRVRRIHHDGSAVIAETDQGRLAARAMVIAAGSWAGQIEIAGRNGGVPVRPVRGQLLHLAWRGTPLRRVTWGERCYLVPWTDGTLLVGATVEEAGFDERTTAAGVSQLIEAASDLVPDVRTAGFRAAKAGLRPGTPDELPIIGPSAQVPNLMYATGHYRSGVLLSPLTARLVADAMLDDRTDPLLQFTRPSRFGDF